MITTILFDLDGTLLPMDQDVFISAYMKGLTLAAAPYGFEPKKLVSSVMAGTFAMVKNDGENTNETVFWKALSDIYGEEIKNQTHIFDEFYKTDFQKISLVCGNTAKANEVVQKAKSLGFRVALATNPLFPKTATFSRICWAGLNPEDFEIFTSFESSHFCKPNLSYYKEVCDALDVSPEECLMVGNDVSEDMITEKLGMKVFLLTDCLINKENTDIKIYPNGNFDDLISFVESLN